MTTDNKASLLKQKHRHDHEKADNVREAVLTYLFPATVSTDHPRGVDHLVVFLCVVARVAGVGLAAAWEPQPAVAVLVVLAGAKLRQRPAFSDGRIFGSFLLFAWPNFNHFASS